MALDHPNRLKRLALLDILPSHHVWTHTSREWATSSWHWLFMVQPAPFPETMMGSVPAQWFMEKKLGKSGIGLAPFTKEAFAEYVRCFNEKTIRGSCGDYRATATIDFELDSQDIQRGNLVSQPMLALWGTKSHTGRVYGDVLAVWQKYAKDIRGGGLDCGHYVPEEAPDAVYEAFIEFFKVGPGSPDPGRGVIVPGAVPDDQQYRVWDYHSTLRQAPVRRTPRQQGNRAAHNRAGNAPREARR